MPRIYSVALDAHRPVLRLEAIISAFRRVARPVRDFVGNVFIPASGNLAYAAVVLLLAAALARRKRIAWRILRSSSGSAARRAARRRAAGVRPERPHRLRTPLNRGQAALITGGSILVDRHRVRRSLHLGAASSSTRRSGTRASAGRSRSRSGCWPSASLIGLGLVSAFPGTITGGVGGKLVYSAQKVLGDTFRFTGAGLRPGARLGQPDPRPDRRDRGAGRVRDAARLPAGRGAPAGRRRAAGSADCSPEYGERDSLGYFATRRDKSAVFSPSGKAAITYRVVNGVSLASGDPIGDPEAWGRRSRRGRRSTRSTRGCRR